MSALSDPEQLARFVVENEWALDSETDPDMRADWRETLNRVMDDRDEDTPADIVDAIAAAVRLDRAQRLTPRVVTTVEELEALHPMLVLIASGRYRFASNGSRFDRCHVRRVDDSITGGEGALFEVLAMGMPSPECLVTAEDIDLPAIVLAPRPEHD